MGIASLNPSYALTLCPDSDGVEPALWANELFGALDDAHFLRAADSRALQHGEDGGSGVAERVLGVRALNARGRK
jgi:hypothetical protein